MERVGILVYLALIALVVFLARRKGREPFPWLVYAVGPWPIALVHALLLKPADAGRKRGEVHDFAIGFLGAAMVGALYLWGLLVIFGLPEGIRHYGQPTHIYGRGIAVVVAGIGGAAWQWKKSRPQAYGFLVAAAVYMFGIIASALTSR